MKIENIKDLKKLIQLCRTTGIEAIEVDGIKLNLGPAPLAIKKTITKTVQTPVYTPGGITEDTQIVTDGLTEEQLLFYSAQGHSEPQQ